MMTKSKKYQKLSCCELCPRKCKVNRFDKTGFCLAPSTCVVARASLHFWEEPCISSKNGSGTVFFSGCNLKCVFCQNHDISQKIKGKEITDEKLGEIFKRLQDKGANNINLVTPTPYVISVINALDMVKKDLFIPVIWNCGGYEDINTIKMLDGYIDIFLPDLKYFDSEISKKYSSAPDYFEIAQKAIIQMVKQTGKYVMDEKGLLKSGVMIRHLILPNNRKDSINIIKFLSENFKKDDILISLMSQYTPPETPLNYNELNRKLTSFEYKSVCEAVLKAGFEGYFQDKCSAKNEYTPSFDLTGVL